MARQPPNGRRQRLHPGSFVLGLLTACSVTFAVVTAGCESTPEGVYTWVEEPSPRLDNPLIDPGKPISFEASPRRARLTGAINETLSFRFAVRAGDRQIDNPTFRIGPFESVAAQIDPSVLQVFRMHRVFIERFPGWHIRSIPPDRRHVRPLDVLVPLRAPQGGMPSAIQQGETYCFWVDVAIPKGTVAGRYTTDIALISGNTTIDVVGVHLTVWPMVLPDEAAAPVIAEIDHHRLFRHHVGLRAGSSSPTADDWRNLPMGDDLNALLRSALRILQAHRLTPVLHELAPLVKVDAHGRVLIDWGQYDAVVEPCLNGREFPNRVPLRLWPMPTSAMFSSLRDDDIMSSAGHTELLRQYLSQCANHFHEKGWLDRSYALPPGAVTVSEESVQTTRAFATTARNADQRIVIASRLWPQDMAPYGWIDYPFAAFAEAVDIWLPPAQFYDLEAMAVQRASGRRTWLTADHPPFSGSIAVHSSPAHVRVLPWQAILLKAEALHVGCINRWPENVDLATPEECLRSDPNVLLYPGGPFGLDEPVPSVRLKHLRRGLQDVAYRKLLYDHGLEHVAATLGRSLTPLAGSDAYRTHFADGRPIGWLHDPLPFDLARDIMAEALLDASYRNSPKTGFDALARDAMWRRFMAAARTLHFNVDGTRLRFTGTPAAWRADVECALTIVNRTRVPVTGTVNLTDLPEGWTASDEGRSLESVAPNSSRRITLTAQTSALPAGSGGIMSLPIEFAAYDGTVHRVQARVACVTAFPFYESIRIDGDLSDWPPGAVNVASGFRLITGESADTSTKRATRPQRSTTGFLVRDSEFLYLAVNCESDVQAGGQASRRNIVEYDDLIPVGDEMIEVLIDPLNTGTRSPTDLYHIVVKPSGTYITEKGIRFEPPCGRRAVWPADIDVATRIYPDRWTVELRIPLAAFGAVTEHTFWGFNITRHNAERQEFSNWSGACGNAYDPLSLGNLYLP